MRKYEPIWNRIKEDKTASITAPPTNHQRIIQAVRKEKWRDAAWRFLHIEKGRKYELREEVIGSVITFRLVDASSITTEIL